MTLFTPPAKAPVMIAAAHELLVDAPHGATPHRRVEGMVTFAASACSAVRRGALGDRGERRADSTLLCPSVVPLLIRTNSSVLISVLRFLRANDFEKVGVERD